MSQPETDADFRARLLRVVSEGDRIVALVGITAQLDALGRRYDRFRYGVALAVTADGTNQSPVPSMQMAHQKVK